MTHRDRKSRAVLLSALALLLAACTSTPTPPPTPASECSPAPEALTLDEGWRFRTDPHDAGLAAGWFSPAFDDTGWQPLTPGRPWEFDGIEYDGLAWYRLQVTLPDWPAVYLGFGGVDDAAALWVNGERAADWDSLGGRAALLDLLEFAEPGEQLYLALRIEDRGGYGGIKQPLRLGQNPRAVMTETQYIIRLADAHPDWPMPAWARSRPLAWTMTGQMEAADEALVSIDGAIAPWATAPTIEAWLYDPATGQLAFASQSEVRFSLVNDRLPLPHWEWGAWGLTVQNTLLGDTQTPATRWQLNVRNESEERRELELLLLARPLSIKEGLSPICALGWQGQERLWVNGRPFMIAATPPAKTGVGSLLECMTAAVQGQVPSQAALSDAPGDAAALWSYPLDLEAGESASFSFAFPSAPGDPFPKVDSDVQARLAEAAAIWEEATGRVKLDLPDKLIEGGVPASMGYLLLALDPDGPHPGPLAHDALWVRDAAYIGLALLQFGHPEAVRAYIPALLEAQEADGRVPPIQGQNAPWDDEEWDAQGQAIFLITSYYRYSGDKDALREWYPALRSAARFLVELRAAQAEADGPAQGLLPPSKSAEDIGPPDWHHYWDDFWAAAGLQEAAYAARELGETGDAAWMQAEADDLRRAILDSIEAVMGSEAAYIPGAVEGLESSAMARGTVPALWPVEVLPRELPLLARSFEYYHRLWIEPYQGGFRHRAGQFWTYGGLELAHAYLRLGQTGVMHQILGWTLTHQTLPGTFAWAEQVSPTDGGFSGGDMPHAWAAASYATLVREMLVSERGGALELFTGVPDWWLGAGQTIGVEKAPTHFGLLTLHTDSAVQQSEAGWDGVLTITLSGAAPPDGFCWTLPQSPAAVDGPPGTAVRDGQLLVPAPGGTVQLTFVSGE